jgi:hypothetical protein
MSATFSRAMRHWCARLRYLPLSSLCCALVWPASLPAQVQPEILVDALGCEVPISTRYHATPDHEGITFEIPHNDGTRIWIGPLAQRATKPLDSQYLGALKVEHYEPGCMAISDLPWAAVQGLHEEVDLVGISDREARHIIEHCNATMNPEATAIAARMAKGCAAVLPTEVARKALLGQAGFASMLTEREGAKKPYVVTSWAIFLPERSPNLQAQGVRKGTLITSICGVPVSEVEQGGATLCCATPVTDHIDATIVEDGKSRTLTGPVPAESRPRPSVTAALQRYGGRLWFMTSRLLR